MLATVHSFALEGINAVPVKVEVDVGGGYPNFAIVGLPATTVRESRERIASALRNSGFGFPSEKIIVNLAPASIPKSGTSLDLPLAVGIMAALQKLSCRRLERTFVAGEVSLDGKVRRVRGVLSMAIRCRQRAGWRFLVPAGNGEEARAIRGIPVSEASDLRQVAELLKGDDWPVSHGTENADGEAPQGPCFSEVRGQPMAKRALEVAAAGGHNVLLLGPPGTGKTLLAGRLPGILPPLSFEESLEVTQIHSAAGLLEAGSGLLWRRPFRAPHHTASPAGLAGGGRPIRPGEISQAHHGVLFLDELPEFSRQVLEILRQPLESGEIKLVRAGWSVRFPSRFTLVAAMNPCPCGHWGDSRKPCRCTETERRRYFTRISGPLLDRLDMHVEVAGMEVEELDGTAGGEPSHVIRARVLQARKTQARRQGTAHCNAALTPKEIPAVCRPSREAKEILRRAFQRLGLSARSYHRILKVSRTVADLQGRETIAADDVIEALQYRILDRREEA
ncbi:MAG: YifB family Mg chelatase-like AAA ATPase [Candidatus Eisenbacteria bacterium]|nr:YifB family Mg chelatase-like AAA ATPase [Candidatus Eisenbacteria bacterium]